MTYLHDTDYNVRTLAGLLPKMPLVTARAWLRCEGQSVNNPTNPLNIRCATGFCHYTSATAGLQAAAHLIKTLTYYVHVRAALLTGNALAIARAIEDSPWAGGHYGGGGAADGCIADYVKAHPTPAPPVDNYVVRTGLKDVRIRSTPHLSGTVLQTVDGGFDAHVTSSITGDAYIVNGIKHTTWLRITAENGHVVSTRYSAATYWQRK
jgi:hypothetical protein